MNTPRSDSGAVLGHASSDNRDISRRRVTWARGLLIILMGCHTFLLAWQAQGDSAWWDEVGHFAAGLSHWYEGTFRLYRVNPPLTRMIACAPVIATSPRIDLGPWPAFNDPWSRPEFPCGARIVAETGPTYFGMLTRARWACIPFSLVVMLISYWWAKDLYGESAAVVAATLWAFSPSALAYAHVITPDAGATAVGLAANYYFGRWLRRSSRGGTVVIGVLLGLALLSKTTWLLLFLIWPLLLITYRVMRREHGLRRDVMRLTTAFFIAVWLVNVGYGFEGSFKQLRTFSFLSHALSGEHGVHQESAMGNRFSHSLLGSLPVALPENYLLGIDYVKMEYERKYWSFLRGDLRLGGWWYYYLYAMLVKEPEGTWLLGALAVGATIFRSKLCNARFSEELVLLAPAVAVLALVSSQTGFNHNLRYVLPAFPFLFIWISKVARSFGKRELAFSGVVIGLLGWSTISSLAVVPHSLSYFNAMSGGPKNGYKLLGSSNTDWGQDLLYLKKWYDANPQARPLHVGSALELIDPHVLGIDWRVIPSGPTAESAAHSTSEELGPKPGWYAISVNYAQDGQHRWDYFEDLAPTEWVGYTLRIFHITPAQADALRRRYGMPPLESAPTLPATRQAQLP